MATLLQGEPAKPGSDALSLRDIPVPGDKLSYIGDYELLEVIAYGGMGVVYRGRQRSLNRIVALKLLLGGQHASRDFKQRFRQEAETAAKLQHPNIVPIYEVGEHEGQPYFSMEYVAGANLATLTREQPLPPRTAADYVKTVAEAIAYAHQQGVVHRDLKPSNILLGPDSRPRVTDFGLARQMDADSNLTTSGEMLGTPGYLPPEQASVKKGTVGPHSDVYALGAVLHCLLTGRPPFMAGTLADTLQQVLNSEPVPLRRLNPTIPRDLETVSLKCLEKEPGRRYASAQALAQDLGRFLAGEPILARPVSLPERAIKWYKREPIVAGLALAISLLLLLGLGVSTLLLVREKAALQSAVSEKRRADGHAEISQAVNEFLQEDLLRQASSDSQADAGHSPNPNLTVREALDRAERHIGQRFKDQPLVEAAVRSAIGDAFAGLGEPDRALPQLERVVELLRTARGPENQETVEMMNNLAQAYQDAGRLTQALPLFEQSLKSEKAMLGPEHPNTLIMMNNLASAYRAAGKANESVLLFEETLKLEQAKVGREDPGTLTTMGNLALAYRAADKLDQALPLFEETLKLQQAKLGREHPTTLATMDNLGSAYQAAGKLDLAIPLLEATFKLQQSSLGPKHARTLVTMGALAAAYHDARRFDLALPLAEETLQLQKAVAGPQHPDTLTSMANLARAYEDAGRFDQAELLLKEALSSMRTNLGPDHPETLKAMIDLARCHRDAGNLDLAVPLFEETLTLCKASLGSDHRLTLVAAAELGSALLSQKKYAEAEPLLVQSYDGFKAQGEKARRSIPEAGRRLVKLYEAWGKPEQANEWRQKLKAEDSLKRER